MKCLKKKNISKKINDPNELSEKLIKDLENLDKNKDNISQLIDDLGDEVLKSTMKNINNFLKNEI